MQRPLRPQCLQLPIRTIAWLLCKALAHVRSKAVLELVRLGRGLRPLVPSGVGEFVAIRSGEVVKDGWATGACSIVSDVHACYI